MFSPPARIKLFIWLSLLLAVTDGLFVWINYQAEQARFQHYLEQRSMHLKNLFEVELDNTAIRVQQTATFIASMPEVQRAFMAGRQAVEAEGGGAGGPNAALARKKLLTLVNAPWQELRSHYDTRQLHFQFGADVTSFLRVHAPDKYGDPLEGVRHSIKDAIQQQRSTAGFECGRIICGIRGVVPVHLGNHSQPGTPFIGVLEAGTSFRTLLELLEKPTHAKFAVLLSMAHLEATYFPERLAVQVRDNPAINGQLIEAALHPEIRQLLQSPPVGQLIKRSGSIWLKLGDRHLAFTAFPLRDYLGHQDRARSPVGTILAWYDIEEEVVQVRNDLWNNIAYAVAAYLVVEILLFLALRTVTRRLETVIATQTSALREQAVHDELTGLYNRHYLDDFIHKEYSLASRHQLTFSVALMDLDFFKRINDQHGHLVGDHVLAETARLVQDRLRASDLAFRYGGEEFLLVFNNTSLQDARAICEDLRQRLESSAIAGLPKGLVTASFGVTEMAEVREPLDTLLQRADQALYLAKDKGRNRVESSFAK